MLHGGPDAWGSCVWLVGQSQAGDGICECVHTPWGVLGASVPASWGIRDTVGNLSLALRPLQRYPRRLST